ncbi:MAG TPA: 3-carboxy-cis,cis-muconate cycloisomerase [Pseudolabrys sp.]|nr:3-carboxy-cis,cis-muconate cycloisomerase [Pseudolabrys sp.]
MPNPLLPSTMLMPLYSSAAMRAVIDDAARLQRMLDVESALASAEAAVGVIPTTAADPIAAACVAEKFDRDALAQASVNGGNLAIPLVKALTAEVAKHDKDAAGYVHWGATSQDIIDTALVLDLRAGIDVLLRDLDAAIKGFAKQATQHRHTPAVARTWLQHALPMPFGLKLAGYAAALKRARDRLAALRNESLVLQFGGAAGTLASLGDRGLAVAEKLGELLGLPVPDAPWHSHRDRLGEVAAALGILATECGKIARDVALLMQTEVGEAFEPAGAGRGGSSTMPHKRNPVAAAAALSCAALAPNLVASILAGHVQEQERALGGWQAEWPAFPALLLVTSGALASVLDIAQGLEVDAARMRANLDITQGLIMAEAVSFALAEKLGKANAHKLVEEASRQAVKDKRHLRDVLKDTAAITSILTHSDLDRLFDPMAYQGVAQSFIDRLLASTNARS